MREGPGRVLKWGVHACNQLRTFPAVMGTHEENGAPVPEQDHKSKHKSKDRDREKKEKRDKKEKSSKSSRHNGEESRDMSGAAADRSADVAGGSANKEAADTSNRRLPSPPLAAPPQQAPGEALQVGPADRRTETVVQDSGGEISMSIEETNRQANEAPFCHLPKMLMRAVMLLHGALAVRSHQIRAQGPHIAGLEAA